MKVENMWKRILAMPDSRAKMDKLWAFAGRCMPYGQRWTIAMNEFNRLYNLGCYWKWQDESKQNG